MIARALSENEIRSMVMLGVWKFDEGSGSLLMDATGHGLNGQIQGATWVTDSTSGHTLDFDGTDDYVVFDSDPQIGGGFSVSAWVRPEQAPAGTGRIVVSTYKNMNPIKYGWYLGDYSGSEDHFWFRVANISGTILAKVEITGFFETYIDEWVHVTGVFSPGQSVALYVNGEKVAEETTSIPTEVSLTDLFKIGAQADASSGFWDGQIDEVRVIARALSQAEVQDLMDPDEVYSKIELTVSTKYYFAGEARLAMRTNGTLHYLLSDHLGSTSVTADANGDFVSEVRYMPWGETRFMSGTVGTDYLYTGQRRDDIGLYYFKARWYDSSLGRFLQADTIVPNPSNPMGFDRYAYVFNNPLRYTDPTGHVLEEGDGSGGGSDYSLSNPAEGIDEEHHDKLRTLHDKAERLSSLMSMGRMDDTEALAQLLDYTAPIYGHDVQGAFTDLGIVVGGLDATGLLQPEVIGREHNLFQYYVGYPAFDSDDQTGFIRDLNPHGQNQVRHFLAGASIAVNLGELGIGHVRTRDEQREDRVLYDLAFEFFITFTYTPLDQAGDWVRNNLAK